MHNELGHLCGKQVVLLCSQLVHLECVADGFRKLSGETFALKDGALEVAHTATRIFVHMPTGVTKEWSKSGITCVKNRGMDAFSTVLELDVSVRVLLRSIRSETVVVACRSLRTSAIVSMGVLRSLSTVDDLSYLFNLTGRSWCLGPIMCLYVLLFSSSFAGKVLPDLDIVSSVLLVNEGAGIGQRLCHEPGKPNNGSDPRTQTFVRGEFYRTNERRVRGSLSI